MTLIYGTRHTVRSATEMSITPTLTDHGPEVMVAQQLPAFLTPRQARDLARILDIAATDAEELARRGDDQ